MDYKEKIDRIVDLLRSSKRAFALTGAGISTESGIPDFRSPGTGLWEKMDPIKTSSASALRLNPAQFYANTMARWSKFRNAEPNYGHYALAELEKMGYLMGVITQNIDGLHRKAGSERVWEVHGHLRTCHCMECKKRFDFELIPAQLDKGVNPPLCPECKGIIRPDVVLFEDPMAEDFYQASRVLSGCDLLLIVGTSLTVYPVAGLPQLARRLVIINLMPTPYDNQAEVVIREKISKVFKDIMERLKETQSG
ncbi:SIR2 family NAD-dependent protein deacylase [Calderihabitans maritimus]|uniref:protein acetyllysine N-acetyltransferase n=1 Tax=Calderihabitans maritimus TaxID=1246530 RepID=A0A1Z5HQR2_9FIRM|nr:NAD-dependent deacylase [Calderihabitans maritimus]GAW91872.1 NAD-dependent deacetylase [Calderihabitans maritimus]